VIEEEEEELVGKSGQVNTSAAKELPKEKEAENPTKGTLFYIAFTLFNSFCYVFAELLY